MYPFFLGFILNLTMTNILGYDSRTAFLYTIALGILILWRKYLLERS